MSKIKFIMIKEVRHILRDPRSLIIAILMPVLMTLLYGYVVTLDTRNIRLAVIDMDKSADSRHLVEEIFHSGYFTEPSSSPYIMDPEKALQNGVAQAVLVIRPGLSKALGSGKPYELGIEIDGADANRATAVLNYTSAIVRNFLKMRDRFGIQTQGVGVSVQILYNPSVESSNFFVPGLIAVILMMISTLLTSVTIAREKETGTLEQLLTAPVTPRQIIAGKVIPYVGLALLDGFLILAFGVFHFGVPFIGSRLLLLSFGVIYIIASLSLGVFISTIVRTQRVAMMTAQISTMLPSIMLSGFVFDIDNMPRVLQYFSFVVPARHFITIIRGIMLKGAGLTTLWKEGAILVFISLVLMLVAIKNFKLKLG